MTPQMSICFFYRYQKFLTGFVGNIVIFPMYVAKKRFMNQRTNPRSAIAIIIPAAVCIASGFPPITELNNWKILVFKLIILKSPYHALTTMHIIKFYSSLSIDSLLRTPANVIPLYLINN